MGLQKAIGRKDLNQSGMRKDLVFLFFPLMKLGKQTKASFMLLIMLFVMMHNAFPHLHHQHDVDSERAAGPKGEFHHHGHDHDHHSDEDDNDHDRKSFFDFLLKNHPHTKHLHQYTPVVLRQVKSVKHLDSKVFVNVDHRISGLRCFDVGLHRFVLFENLVPEYPYLNNHPHRGPPSLG